jgi:hypothetical protein
MRAVRSTRFVLAVCLAAFPTAAGAQDSHYWNIQYGPVATLLGGNVVGSTRDLSATFYNPGGLILSDDPSFLLSTESFQVEKVKLTPAGGSPLFTVDSSAIGAAPTLIAGNLPKSWGGRNGQWAWSYLTRQRFNTRLNQHLAGPLAGTASSGSAETLFDQRLSEDWGGVTYSHALGDTFGLGATLYGAYRSQRTRSETNLQATSPSGAGVTVLSVDDFDYGHARTLLKLGLAKDWKKWQGGLTVTTPSLKVLGKGRASFTRSVSGVDANGDGRPDTVVAANSEDDLEAEAKSSWAVGAGAAHRRGSSRFHLSAEWYAPVPTFTVLDPGSFASVPSGPRFDPQLAQKLDAVLNAGFGFEHEFSRDLSVYGALHTDFSAAPLDRNLNTGASDWDLYHVTAGTAFRMGSMRFTLGAGWAFGGRTEDITFQLPANVPAIATSQGVKVRYSRLTFLLGFVFGS